MVFAFLQKNSSKSDLKNDVGIKKATATVPGTAKQEKGYRGLWQ